MEKQRVQYEVRDGVAVLTMDDGKVNAINDDFLDQLHAGLDSAENDDAVKAVVLAGRPGLYSAGLDLKTLPTLDHAGKHAFVVRFGDSMIRLAGFPKPVVAAVTGHALAGGCVMLLCTDHRIGPEGDFKIGLNEVAIGLPLPTFVIELARLAVAPRDLPKCTMGAMVFDSAGAKEVGYLDQLAAPEAVVDTAVGLASKLGMLNGVAFTLTKTRLKRSVLVDGNEAAAAEIDRFLKSGPFA